MERGLNCEGGRKHGLPFKRRVNLPLPPGLLIEEGCQSAKEATMVSVTRRQHVVLEGFREMLDRIALKEAWLLRALSHSHDLLREGVNATMRGRQTEQGTSQCV